MTNKFYGSIAQMQRDVRDCNVFGEWRRIPLGHCRQFRSTAGEVLNWWPNTGTVTFQGHPGPLQRRFTAVCGACDGALGGRSVIRLPGRVLHSIPH